MTNTRLENKYQEVAMAEEIRKVTPITVSIFGASGVTGQCLIQQALDHGHHIRAHCRASSAWTPPEDVSVFRSEFNDLACLRTVVQGSDAVFCLLGTRPPHRDVFCASATQAIVEAMTRERVDRLLCLTGAVSAPQAAHLSISLRAMAALFRQFRPKVAADRDAQEALVCQSHLRWTVFKPSRLTSGPATGHLRANTNLRLGLRSFVSRIELTAHMIMAAEQNLYIGERLYLDAV